jgi:hypothetical protein
MKKMFRNFAIGLVFLLSLLGAADAQQSPVTPQAHRLEQELDSMGVETKWIAGGHIDWQTGDNDGEAEKFAGRHTHCSAFVASAAEKFGVYILRPPQHPQELLANAQNEWLATEGAANGWRALSGPQEAQDAANRGQLVVASYHNHRDDKPGHIAIVRPAEKSARDIEEQGPDVIQAATVNSSSISVKAGFAGHVYAWNNNEIDYYAHSVKILAPLPGRAPAR